MTGKGLFDKALRRSLLLRSFFLQASWNFEQMQGLGTLFVLAPLLRALYRGEALNQAYARHLSYFNTHPFLSPLVLGGTARIEAESAGTNGAEAIEFRQMLMAPCAAMGDAFFWGGVRPFAAVVAMIFALHGSLLAPVILLGIFNLPHLVVRSVGMVKGSELGYEVIDFLERCRLPDLAIRLKQGTLLLLGFLCAELTVHTLDGARTSVLWGWGILPAVLLLGWPARRRISPLLLALLVTVTILALTGDY